MNLIFRILANAAAILIAAKLVPGFIFAGSPVELLIAGAVLGLINALVKPILQLISFPIIFLTLGLFNIIINIALLLLAAKFLPYLRIETFLAAFLGVVILAIMNHLVTKLNRHGDMNKY